MDNAVKEKRKAWNQWKNGGTKKECLKARKTAKTAVYFVKSDAQKNSLPALTITLIKIAFLKWLKD